MPKVRLALALGPPLATAHRLDVPNGTEAYRVEHYVP